MPNDVDKVRSVLAALRPFRRMRADSNFTPRTVLTAIDYLVQAAEALFTRLEMFEARLVALEVEKNDPKG